MYELKITVETKALFKSIEDKEIVLSTILEKLSADFIIFQCCVINCYINGYGQPSDQQRNIDMINRYLTRNSISRIKEYMIAKRKQGEAQMFSRGQMLELVRHASIHCNYQNYDISNDLTYEEKEQFCKASLVSAGLWSKRIYKNIKDAVEPGGLTRAAMMRKGIEESGGIADFGIALGRGIEIFEKHYIKHMPAFEEIFRNITGLSLEDYFRCSAALSTFTMPSMKAGMIFNVETFAKQTSIEMQDKLSKFVSLKSQNRGALRDGFAVNYEKDGYKSLREKPIYTNGRECAILDPEAFYGSMSVSPLFEIVSKSAGEFRVASDTAFSAFGFAFEDYVIEIFDRMRKVGKDSGTHVEFNFKGDYPKGRNYEIDVFIERVVNRVKQVFLFEIKGVFISEADLMSDNTLAHADNLILKYASMDNKTGKLKGALQLANASNAFVDGYVPSKLGIQDELRIYCTLIAHDDYIDMLGVFAILNDIFKSKLNQSHFGVRVNDLNLLPVRIIEKLESLNNIDEFLDMIVEFSDDRKYEQFDSYIPQSRAGNGVSPSKYLLDSASERLKEFQGTIFMGNG